MGGLYIPSEKFEEISSRIKLLKSYVFERDKFPMINNAEHLSHMVELQTLNRIIECSKLAVESELKAFLDPLVSNLLLKSASETPVLRNATYKIMLLSDGKNTNT